MHEIINFIVESVSVLGYKGIVLLMLIESSFIPFPSEVVMVPAGYLAYKGEMNVAIVVLCGTLGSLLGALLNYYLAVFLGRPFLRRYGKYFFLEEAKLLKVEEFFAKHGAFSTFTGRLIPVIRQLISVPAGLAKMNLLKFSFYTSLGAGIWSLILTLIGFYLGHNEELIKEYKVTITILMLVGIIFMITFYVINFKKKRKLTK